MSSTSRWTLFARVIDLVVSLKDFFRLLQRLTGRSGDGVLVTHIRARVYPTFNGPTMQAMLRRQRRHEGIHVTRCRSCHESE